MSTLEKMGIQQWRLRKPIDSADISQKTPLQETTSTIRNDGAIEVNQSSVAAPLLPAIESAPVTDTPLEKASDQLDWPEMENLLIAGTQCKSCSAQNSLLGSGARTADWLFICDSPNSKEVAASAFFDGRAGQLFEAMLHAMTLARQQVYCTSIFKCAPTEDLSSFPQCGDWVHQQIALIKPAVIIVFGEFTAQTMLKSNEPLDRLRESVQLCRRSDTKVIATYSPRDMLDEPHLKAQVWADLKKAMHL